MLSPFDPEKASSILNGFMRAEKQVYCFARAKVLHNRLGRAGDREPGRNSCKERGFQCAGITWEREVEWDQADGDDDGDEEDEEDEDEEDEEDEDEDGDSRGDGMGEDGGNDGGRDGLLLALLRARCHFLIRQLMNHCSTWSKLSPVALAKVSFSATVGYGSSKFARAQPSRWATTQLGKSVLRCPSVGWPANLT